VFFLFRLTVHLTKPVQCFFSSIKTLLVFYVHLMLTQRFDVFLRAVTFVTMIAMACCESVRLAGFWCSLSLLFYIVYKICTDKGEGDKEDRLSLLRITV